MGQRISISDAPEAKLGDEGAIQNIPLAEVRGNNEGVPMRTTIAALKAFIGGGQPPSTKLACRINVPGSGTAVIQIEPFNEPNHRFGPVNVNWQIGGTQYFQGSEDDLVVEGQGIRAKRDILIRLTGQLTCRYDSSGQINARRYTMGMGISQGVPQSIAWAAPMRPRAIGVNIPTFTINIDKIFNMTENEILTSLAWVENTGSAQGSSSEESVLILGAPQSFLNVTEI